MAARTKRKTSVRTGSSRAGRANDGRRKGSKQFRNRLGGLFLPAVLSVFIVVCIGALGFLSYRSVTASNFFDVQNIDVRGTVRAPKKEIGRIVAAETERAGAWNADLLEIKQKVEKIPFVKTAAVSRVLPNGIRVSVIEREPLAVVRLAAGDSLVDADGKVLALAEGQEVKLPFTMTGWDETKSEKAYKDNIERVRMYQKMVAEWQQSDLVSRVKSIDLSDMREPRAFTEDSGQMVAIGLGKDNFGEHLKRGISAIVGKGEAFDAVNLVGPNLILSSRKK